MRAIEVRRAMREHHFQTADGEEHLFAREPMTAAELLVALVDEASRPCRRQVCGSVAGALQNEERLVRQLQEVTAERDALERLLTRRRQMGYS